MDLKEKLIRQLKFYHLATDIHLQLSDEKGTVLRVYGEPFSYCKMLLETNMSLVAVASELGFDNQSYFSRIFKRQLGISPKLYRQNGGK